ncbi:unnamed protein product [Cylicocyclus nassatus]|uniref:Apple domain-containing protein n=1 Tax=Cylicocyclus nassatus TaxID=53992 RepID=A0AA36DPR7_CYLNA|nr:unnamed protein product [Cylicocyclus nassatus]
MLVVIAGEATQFSSTRAQKYKCRLGRAGLSEKERILFAGAVLGVLPKKRPKYNCYLELPALLWVTSIKLYSQYLAAYGPTSSGRERWEVVDATFRSNETSQVMLEKAIKKMHQKISSKSMFFTGSILVILFLANPALNSGVFRHNTAAFYGDLLYQIFSKEEALCLRACYEESECAFVDYREDVKACSLYRQGSTSTWGGYILYREETDASCITEMASNFRRLFFGEIYNTTGYYFLDAYAFADYCVAMGQCLGADKIQEYEDEQGNFYYEMPGRSDLNDSGLGQTFFIAKRI